MKRINLSFLILFVLVINTLAQQEDQLDYDKLAKKLVKSDVAIQNPKKNIDPKLWLERGNMFIDIANVNTQFLFKGVPVAKVKEVYGEQPKSLTKKGKVDEYVYDKITINVVNGLVDSWTETQTICANPLDSALFAFSKADSLDQAKKISKDLTTGITKVRDKYKYLALLCYSKKDYAGAFDFFKKMLGANELKQINKMDTIIVYNAGLMAGFSGNKDEALKYFQKAADLGYKDTSLYKDLKNMYYIRKDSANALKTINQGLLIYPENIDLLTAIVYHYVNAGEKKKAMEFISRAKQKNPNNKIFWSVEGSYYTKEGDSDSAIICYTKATELDSTYFLAFYRMGEIHLLKAIDLAKEANSQVDNKKYLDKKAIADVEFKKAIPYLERAYRVLVKDNQSFDRQQATLENLNRIYIRFKKDDPQINDRFEQINKLLANLKTKK